MGPSWVYTDAEIRILTLVKNRIKSEFKSKGIEITGGIFIKPKSKNSRLDLFEINGTLHKRESFQRITKEFIMSVNLNYQDTEKERVLDYTEFLYYTLIDSVLTKNLIFRRYYQNMEFQTFRISPYLWLGNCPFYITHTSKLKLI